MHRSTVFSDAIVTVATLLALAGCGADEAPRDAGVDAPEAPREAPPSAAELTPVLPLLAPSPVLPDLGPVPLRRVPETYEIAPPLVSPPPTATMHELEAPTDHMPVLDAPTHDPMPRTPATSSDPMPVISGVEKPQHDRVPFNAGG